MVGQRGFIGRIEQGVIEDDYVEVESSRGLFFGENETGELLVVVFVATAKYRAIQGME